MEVLSLNFVKSCQEVAKRLAKLKRLLGSCRLYTERESLEYGRTEMLVCNPGAPHQLLPDRQPKITTRMFGCYGGVRPLHSATGMYTVTANP